MEFEWSQMVPLSPHLECETRTFPGLALTPEQYSPYPAGLQIYIIQVDNGISLYDTLFPSSKTNTGFLLLIGTNPASIVKINLTFQHDNRTNYHHQPLPKFPLLPYKLAVVLHDGLTVLSAPVPLVLLKLACRQGHHWLFCRCPTFLIRKHCN